MPKCTPQQCHQTKHIRGKDIPCKMCQRMRRIRRLKKLMTFEAQASEIMYFITLTYRRRVVSYEDVKLYLKRCRKRIGKRYRFKYVCVFEKGTKTDSPHYHLLIYGNSSMRTRDFRKWRKGFLHLITVKRGSTQKAAKYIFKTHQYIVKDPLQRIRKSNHLGEQWQRQLLEHPVLMRAMSDLGCGATISGIRPKGMNAQYRYKPTIEFPEYTTRLSTRALLAELSTCTATVETPTSQGKEDDRRR